MPAPAPTFGNAAGDDLDMPEIGTTAGLSVTMFLNEPFHTQQIDVGDGHLVVILTVLAWFESVSLSFLKTQSIFSILVIFCCENVHII